MFRRTLFVQLFLLAALSAIGYTSAGDVDHDANGSAAGQLRVANSEAGKTMTDNRQLESGKGKGKGKEKGKGKGKGKGGDESYDAIESGYVSGYGKGKGGDASSYGHESGYVSSYGKGKGKGGDASYYGHESGYGSGYGKGKGKGKGGGESYGYDNGYTVVYGKGKGKGGGSAYGYGYGKGKGKGGGGYGAPTLSPSPSPPSPSPPSPFPPGTPTPAPTDPGFNPGCVEVPITESFLFMSADLAIPPTSSDPNEIGTTFIYQPSPLLDAANSSAEIPNSRVTGVCTRTLESVGDVGGGGSCQFTVRQDGSSVTFGGFVADYVLDSPPPSLVISGGSNANTGITGEVSLLPLDGTGAPFTGDIFFDAFGYQILVTGVILVCEVIEG